MHHERGAGNKTGIRPPERNVQPRTCERFESVRIFRSPTDQTDEAIPVETPELSTQRAEHD